jgi:HK97 family phage major capsid protein
MLKRSIQVLGSGLDYVGVRPVVTLHNGRPHYLWPDGKLLPVVAGGAVNDVIESDASDDPLIPTPVAAEVIKELPKSSVVMQLARKRPMSTKSLRQPVLSVLPEAYFVDGDQGLKQTTKQDWENLVLIAEEIAVIVVIPDNYLDDAQVPIWDEVRPEIVSAFGRKIDLATLFGIDKPSTWGSAVVPHAEAAGNVVTEGDFDDIALDVSNLARIMAEKGASANAFAAAPGFNWRLVGLRSNDGVPIYSAPTEAAPGRLYGRTVSEVDNGGWDPTQASLIAGNWQKAIVGTRTDMRFRLFTEGVISDSDGKVIVNLMQQDSVALRAVMRLGWQLANPVNPLATVAEERSYFGILEPLGAS